MTELIRVELGEYEGRRLEHVPQPTAPDLRLADQLLADETEPRLEVRWLANGAVDIKAASWVGVVRFTHLEIHVVPKLVGGALRVLRMLEFSSGVSMIRRLPTQRPLAARGRDLLDLVCLLLVEETKALLREGLLRNYRTTDDTLKVLRGRLRFRDQYLQRFGQLDRLECHFDEYDSDAPENQLVAAALTLALRRAREPDIRLTALRLARLFAEACEPPTSEATWYERAITYDRRNSRYRPAHELSKLVLRGLAYDDMYDTSAGDVTAFLLDMNRMFERFVQRLVEHALRGMGLRVTGQQRTRAVIVNDATGRSYSTIVPDIVLETADGAHRTPIDVKYKLYDTRKVSTADIYQAFLYAYALSTGVTGHRAGIVYPATSSAAGPTLSIKPLHGPATARIAALGIDVPRVLETIGGSGELELLTEVRGAVLRLAGLDVSEPNLV